MSPIKQGSGNIESINPEKFPLFSNCSKSFKILVRKVLFFLKRSEIEINWCGFQLPTLAIICTVLATLLTGGTLRAKWGYVLAHCTAPPY